jgi:hypothetical protein
MENLDIDSDGDWEAEKSVRSSNWKTTLKFEILKDRGPECGMFH